MKKLLSAKHQIKDSEWVRKSEKTKSKHLRICQWCARTKSSNKLQHRNFCQSCFIYFSPNKTRLKFDHDFKACWSFCFKLNLLNESNYSMPWVRCTFGNIFPMHAVQLLSRVCYTHIRAYNAMSRWHCAPCICIYNYLCILIVHPDQLLWCMHTCVFVLHLY